MTPQINPLTFENITLKTVVKTIQFYGNLCLNDIVKNTQGEVKILTEMPRKDQKQPRSYLELSLISLENLNINCTIKIWQTYPQDKTQPTWDIIQPNLRTSDFDNQLSSTALFNTPFDIDSKIGSPIDGYIVVVKCDLKVAPNTIIKIFAPQINSEEELKKLVETMLQIEILRVTFAKIKT